MYILVYGSLRYGFELHHYLRRARFVGLAFAEGYDMFNLGGYPGVVKGEGRVWGEVYEVDERTISILDQIEDFKGEPDDLYVREQTRVYFDEKRSFYLDNVFLYRYNQDVGDKEPIVGGDYSRWIRMPVITNYFAYAENTNYEVLEERGVREVLREVNAILPGYRLIFNIPCKYGLCANLKEDPEGKVCGYIYMLTEDSLNSLDKAEEHIIKYLRRVVKVQDQEGKTYFAVAYLSDFKENSGPPSPQYKEIIIRGLNRRWKGECLSTGL